MYKETTWKPLSQRKRTSESNERILIKQISRKASLTKKLKLKNSWKTKLKREIELKKKEKVLRTSERKDKRKVLWIEKKRPKKTKDLKELKIETQMICLVEREENPFKEKKRKT